MRKLILFCALALTTLHVSAQKYGHCNFGNLIAQMPETKVSDEALTELNNKLTADIEKKAEQLQAEYNAYQEARQSGNESPRQLAEREKKIGALQEEGTKMQQEMAQSIDQKRNELLGPIVQRARDAIDAVAKENGFVLIFDTSIFNALLYTQESDDVMPLVKAKLGIE